MKLCCTFRTVSRTLSVRIESSEAPSNTVFRSPRSAWSSSTRPSPSASCRAAPTHSRALRRIGEPERAVARGHRRPRRPADGSRVPRDDAAPQPGRLPRYRRTDRSHLRPAEGMRKEVCDGKAHRGGVRRDGGGLRSITAGGLGDRRPGPRRPAALRTGRPPKGTPRRGRTPTTSVRLPEELREH